MRISVVLLFTIGVHAEIAGDAPAVAPVPDAIREQFKLAPFYQKHIDVGGLPIVGSTKVSDAALAECAWIVRNMLEKRADLLKAMAEAKVRFAVMAYNEYTTDIPEHAHLNPRVYWDRRARGLGATRKAPAVSGGEENLLAFPGDAYPRENISIHEFAHAIHEMGLKTVDPAFDDRLRKAYESAMAAGLWKHTYAAVNRHEYWAEAVQAWFDNNDANNALHNDINTRMKLKEYDPGAAALCAEVFGDGAWRYRKPWDRPAQDRAHLAGLDPSKTPRFQWRQEVMPDRPRITFQSAKGEIEMELFGPREPLGQLLAQIHKGYYSGGNAKISSTHIDLTPAGQTPDGTAIPTDDGKWTIQFGEPSSDTITAKVVKGVSVLAQISAEPNGIHIQRAVRLN